MKLSVGTDIIEINRIKRLIDKDSKFIEKMYTDKEILYCESKKEQKYQSYAARFAAKEAIYKALSDKITSYTWKDFEIINSNKGKPEVFLHLDIDEIDSIEISISHCKEYAVAYVTAILKES